MADPVAIGGNNLQTCEENEMKNMRYTAIILTAVALLFGLTACYKSLSSGQTVTRPQLTNTAAVQATNAGPTNDIMAQLGAFATQTAMATQGLIQPQQTGEAAGQTPAAGTPVAAVATQAGGATQPAATQPAATQAPATPAAPAGPTATLRPYATPTPGRPASYTIQKGEHPYCIARRFDVNPIEMLNKSGLGGTSLYPPGTVLRIPQSGSFPDGRSLKSHPDTYTVRQGDTLNSIACLYGDVDPNSIAAVNGLNNSSDLKPGQNIQIP
jgi:LysM repeat protein